ncbi:MAG: hypothetical protein IPH71_10875 [Proteobacteria bacterium]|nr:hypothetical protein [Pseudomonadota bacterium]
MNRSKILLTATLCVSFAVLPGCKRLFARSCSKPQVYAEAQTLPRFGSRWVLMARTRERR